MNSRIESFYIVSSSAIVGMCCNVLKTTLYYNLTQKVHTKCVDFQILKNYSYISGILSDSPSLISLFQIVTVLISGCMLWVSSKKFKKVHFIYILSPWLMFAGFLGNAIDWFYRGYVIDYFKINIPYNNYYTNCEDLFIETGIILFIIHLLFRNKVIEQIYRR